MAETKGRTPEKLGDLHATPPMKVAAGLSCDQRNCHKRLPKMGPVRATRALVALNQKGGIDCPSCAWPDPDDKRTVCRVLLKAARLADEATTKKVESSFGASTMSRTIG